MDAFRQWERQEKDAADIIQRYRAHYVPLLHAGEWNKILPFPEPICHRKEAFLFRSELFLVIPSVEEAVTQAIRLFPSYTTHQWTIALQYHPEFYRKEMFQAFLDQHIMDLNRNVLLHIIIDPTSRWLTVEEQQERAEMLFQAGVDINEYDELGKKPYLMEYLYNVLVPILRGGAEERTRVETYVRAMLPWLLSKGADPLLENRYGQHALTLVSLFREPFRTWIKQELERWA